MDTIKPTVNRQSEIPEKLVLPLDPALFNPSPVAMEFLKSTVSGDEEEIRRRVQEVVYVNYPYPCLRGLHHVALFMSSNNIYPRVIELGMSDPSAVLLDIGCCMGTNVRKAAYDGYPASQIIGCDLLPHFLALGRKLYGDADTYPIRFIQGDVFKLESPSSLQSAMAATSPEFPVNSLADLRGCVTVIYTGVLFHLFDESTQYAMALRLVSLLRRDKPSIIFGRHQGLAEAGLIDDHYTRVRYGHSPESWTELWIAVFTATHGEGFAKDRVAVAAELRPSRGPAVTAAGKVDRYMLYWSVTIRL